MDYEWTQSKSDWNLAERGLSFEVGPWVLNGPHELYVDTRRDYGEVRFVAVGSYEGRKVVVVYAEQDGIRRIISLRYANDRERNGKWGKLFVKV